MYVMLSKLLQGKFCYTRIAKQRKQYAALNRKDQEIGNKKAEAETKLERFKFELERIEGFSPRGRS
jgi:DNA repair ATPase RecN